MKDLTDFLDKYNQIYEIVDDKVIGDIINLSHTNLTSLPESIGNLKCNDLYLCINDLTSLPESISSLECELLDLRYTKLQYLPKLNENIKKLFIDNFKDLTNLLYLQNLTELFLVDDYYDSDKLRVILNNIRHQKVMNDMNKILQTL